MVDSRRHTVDSTGGRAKRFEDLEVWRKAHENAIH